jgi:hypothetical protein
MAKYYLSPIGPFIHPWINKPDTEFNADGLYKVKVRAKGPPAEQLAAKIDGLAEASLQVHTQEMKPGEAKKWTRYVPYERVTDDEGQETGEIDFLFKQNAKIPSKKEPSGFKDITIAIHDSADNRIDVQVWSGSEGRVMFSTRDTVMTSSKMAGIRLDFAKVQITKLKTGGGASQGFGAVEDGYVADQENVGFGQAPKGGAADDTGGDY